MVKAGQWEISTAEFEQQYLRATQRGMAEVITEPQARHAYYEATANRLVIELKNGLTLLVPCSLIEGLAEAQPQDLAQIELLPRGAALHWVKLDVHLSVAGLLKGVFGSQAWMTQLNQTSGLTKQVAS